MLPLLAKVGWVDLISVNQTNTRFNQCVELRFELLHLVWRQRLHTLIDIFQNTISSSRKLT